MYEAIEKSFELIIRYSALILDCLGAIAILAYAIRAVLNVIKGVAFSRVLLFEGVALALEFFMCGEALQTIMVRDYKELLFTGGIMLLRAMMSFLIHYQMKLEKHDHVEPGEKNARHGKHEAHEEREGAA